jgi:two-component sensor histidine kinase
MSMPRGPTLPSRVFHGSARMRIDGPAVMLEPSTAQAVAISLHELATNAAKYGSLSGSGWSR